MKIIRRYGTSPAERGSASGQTCPDVLRLDSGDYLVIGRLPGTPRISVTELIKHSASIGDGEQAVIVPADVLHAAAREIVAEQS